MDPDVTYEPITLEELDAPEPPGQDPDLILGSRSEVLRTIAERRAAGATPQALKRDLNVSQSFPDEVLEHAADLGAQYKQYRDTGRYTPRGRQRLHRGVGPLPFKTNAERDAFIKAGGNIDELMAANHAQLRGSGPV